MADELDAPLGQKKQKPNKNKDKKSSDRARKGWRSLVQFQSGKLPLTRIFLGLFFGVIAIFGAIIVFIDNPNGGRPEANVAISNSPVNNQVATRISTPAASVSPDVVNIEEPISLPNNSGTSIEIITIDDSLDSNSSISSIGIAKINEFGVFVDLAEKTPNGPIPIIGTSGETAFNAYARASTTRNAAVDKTLVAIVVTGLGLNEAGTLEAINKLPDAVTLAFVPYGRTLKRTSAAARNGGHETLLSLPLEPFDYPQNDPGPQTLLTDQPARANLDKLFWLMARFGGYVGVINHMGAKFTASASDFNPIMEELALRGLGYIDDGSSRRSLAANLAGNNRVPFGYSVVQIDSNPTRTAILGALDELEQQAAKNNGAIGVASALPITIKTIEQWAKTLKERNIILVPASALMK